MSHTRLKTQYAVEGIFGSTDYNWLFCDHNHSNDVTTFYNEDGRVQSMCFAEWEPGNDLLDAMERLLDPFKDDWNGELKEKVERWYGKFPNTND